jgi:hypothetical protein
VATFYTDIRDFLDERGELPLDGRLRRRAIRLAQLVEYGGVLEPGQFRETLVCCVARPGRKPCPGLLWVEKLPDHRIFAWCPACEWSPRRTKLSGCRAR